MDILYLLIPLSVVLAFAIGAAFLWSVRSGQFDDLEGPSHRILQDDDNAPQPGNSARTASSLTDPRNNIHG
jgi:cbb3-type cytochrome oxidase maturation protein